MPRGISLPKRCSMQFDSCVAGGTKRSAFVSRWFGDKKPPYRSQFVLVTNHFDSRPSSLTRVDRFSDPCSFILGRNSTRSLQARPRCTSIDQPFPYRSKEFMSLAVVSLKPFKNVLYRRCRFTIVVVLSNVAFSPTILFPELAASFIASAVSSVRLTNFPLNIKKISWVPEAGQPLQTAEILDVILASPPEINRSAFRGRYFRVRIRY